MCLHLYEHEFPFLLPVLTVQVLTGGQLLHIIKKQQQQPLLFSYTFSDSTAYIWMSVIKTVFFRSGKLIKMLVFWFYIVACNQVSF